MILDYTNGRPRDIQIGIYTTITNQDGTMLEVIKEADLTSLSFSLNPATVSTYKILGANFSPLFLTLFIGGTGSTGL